MTTQVRFNHRNCMPARTEFPAFYNRMNWIWNDSPDGNKNRSVALANIVETGEGFRIELAVPGHQKNDFKIKLENQILVISGDIENDAENTDESYVRKEFSRSSFSRSFRLSDRVDSVNIAAKYENGILLVTIPKIEVVKAPPAQDIEIN